MCRKALESIERIFHYENVGTLQFFQVHLLFNNEVSYPFFVSLGNKRMTIAAGSFESKKDCGFRKRGPAAVHQKFRYLHIRLSLKEFPFYDDRNIRYMISQSLLFNGDRRLLCSRSRYRPRAPIHSLNIQWMQ